LHETLPYFTDSRVGLVQVRWEFVNRGETLLTRLQSMILDGLFALDQHVKAGSGLPLQFNGTSGIWRRRCLEEAGPWREDALTEDADLSFRAQVKGWRLVHRRDYVVPTELPRNMASFRTQQKRWAAGSGQVLRRLAGQVLRSPLAWSAKLTMLLHMFRHVIFVLIFLSCIAAPGTTLFRMPFLVNYGAVPNLSMLLILTGSLFVYHAAALRVTGRPWHRAALSPLVIPLLLGMSFIYSISFLRGLLLGGGEFVRTPKRGDAESDQRADGPRYRSRRDPVALLEVLLGLAYGLFCSLLLDHGIYIYGVLFGGVAGSFLWVGLGSLLPRTPLSRR
jgi:cellulose synthase/poly-beta-1,6-N-acetylglucosamine synthase-like glycosyltransferase